MITLGEQSKKYRISIRMSQADFASRLGVTGASVSAYETGTRLPSYDILVKVSNILGVSTDTLLGRGKAGAVTVDVTGLTEEQRHLIRSTVEIFQQYNALRTTGGEGGDP